MGRIDDTYGKTFFSRVESKKGGLVSHDNSQIAPESTENGYVTEDWKEISKHADLNSDPVVRRIDDITLPSHVVLVEGQFIPNVD